MNRIGLLQDLVSSKDADALYLTSLPDIRWACGFTGSNGVLLVCPDEAYFVTDGRYRGQASAEVSNARVAAPGYDLVGHIAEQALLTSGARVLYQADHLTVSARQALGERLPGVEWVGEDELLVRLVASKSPEEIDRIRAAQAVTEQVFDVLKGWLRPGLTEKEVAAQIVYEHLRRGADKMAFEPIVASGPNSALPHARPTERALRAGEIVLLDFGCMLKGYASDMTRVVALGPPHDPAVREVYDLVLDAQEQAIEHARAGMSSSQVDALARDVIEAAGYGDAFTHGLGHGVGLQVHEWPRVSYSVDYDLPARAVVSIEPGVYLPGRFGVRIEDLVLLGFEGCQNLTRAAKAWTVL